MHFPLCSKFPMPPPICMFICLYSGVCSDMHQFTRVNPCFLQRCAVRQQARGFAHARLLMAKKYVSKLPFCWLNLHTP